MFVSTARTHVAARDCRRTPAIVAGFIATVGAIALLAGCASGSSGIPANTPATDDKGIPNYANSSNWLSLPAESAEAVDVFFLYPTIYQQAASSDPMVCAVDNAQMRSGAPTLSPPQAPRTRRAPSGRT